jgi:hypothetical protein
MFSGEEFSEGDHVRVTHDHRGLGLHGVTGHVMEVRPGTGRRIRVEFDAPHWESEQLRLLDSSFLDLELERIP